MPSIFKRVMTVIRGHVSDAGEAFADANALTELDQQRRDAESNIEKATDELSSIAGKRKVETDRLNKLTGDKDRYLSAAQQLIEKGDESLAIEAAEKVAALEEEIEGVEKVVANYKSTEDRLRKQIGQLNDLVGDLKRGIEQARANDALVKAQEGLASTGSGIVNSMSDARKSLDRLNKRHAEKSAKFEAAMELADEQSGSSLDKKLAEAGIGANRRSAQDILAGLKK